jgi:hypothetical protein
MADQDWKIDVGVPDVGDIVEYAMHGKTDRYRVTGWYREMMAPKPIDYNNLRELPWDNILYDAQQKIHGKKLKSCYREEAQFVGLAGVGGTIAPVDDVKVVGKVNWPPERIEEARQQALFFAEKGEVVF